MSFQLRATAILERTLETNAGEEYIPDPDITGFSTLVKINCRLNALPSITIFLYVSQHMERRLF